jgi:hypothetical protein
VGTRGDGVPLFFSSTQNIFIFDQITDRLLFSNCQRFMSHSVVFDERLSYLILNLN